MAVSGKYESAACAKEVIKNRFKHRSVLARPRWGVHVRATPALNLEITIRFLHVGLDLYMNQKINC